MNLDILKKIIKTINDILLDLELSSEQINVDLTSLGMDSIAFIHIIVALEENFDIEIPDDKLLLTEMNTVKKIYDVVFEEMNEPTQLKG